MTAPFQSSKFLIEAGPVNWYEPHAKAVAERNAQEEKARAEKEAQTAQKLKVYKEEDPILKLAAISKTIQAAAKLTSAVAKVKKAEKKKEKEELETKVKDLNFRWNIGDERAQAIARSSVGWEGPRDKVFTTENKKFKALLEPGGLLHGPEYAGYVDELRTIGPRMQTQLLESYTIRESHRLADPLSYEKSQEWKERYNSGIEGALTPDDWNKKAKTPQGALEHKSWWYDRIKAMGHSDELTKKYMGSELTRALSTKKNTDLASTKFRIDKKDKAIAEGFYLTKGNTIDSSDIPRLYVDRINQVAEGLEDITENGKVIQTAMQQAAQIVDAEFDKVNGTGFVPRLAVQDFENYRFKHPAGKGGYANIREAFFGGDDSFLVKIIQTNERGQKRYLAVQSTLANQYAKELLTMGGTGKMSKQDFDVAVLNLKAGGHLSPQMITALERVDPTVQSRSIAESEQLRLDAVVSTGRTSNFDDVIAGFTQNSVAEEGKTVKQKLKKFRSDLGVDTTSSEAGNNSDGFTKGVINDKLKLKLEPLDHLSMGTQRTAQRIMSRIRDQEIGKQFIAADKAGTLNDKGALDLIASQVVVNVERRWNELGFNKTWGTEGAGPLSADITSKSFPGLKSYHAALVEAGNESRIGSPVEESVVQIENLKKEMKNRNLTHRTGLLDIPGLAVTNREFLAISKSIDPTTGRITWPPDVLMKAHAMNMHPGAIAFRQLNALLSSTEQIDKDFVKLHGLDNPELMAALDKVNKADTKFRQFLTDQNDPYLPPNMNIQYMTPDQFKRIQIAEQGLSKHRGLHNLPITTYEAEKILDEQNRRRKKREKEKNELIKQGAQFPQQASDDMYKV